VASSGLGLWQFFQGRRMERIKLEIYKRQLLTYRDKMVEMHDKQRYFYAYNYPTVEAAIRLVHSEPDSRLWERRIYDNDFGFVRLGIGTSPSTYTFKPPNGENAESPVIFDAIKLAEDSRLVRDISIAIPLRPRSTDTPEDNEMITLGERLQAPGRYALGISSPDRERLQSVVRSMLISFTAFHSPNDARIYVVGSGECKKDWDWARWLPHCNNSRDESGKGDLMAFEKRAVRRIWAEIQGELERRQLRMEDENAGDVTLPFLLVFVDGHSASGPDSPLGAVSTEAAVSLLMSQGPFLGASVVFLTDNRDAIPSDCRSILEIEWIGEDQDNPRTIFRYAEVGLNTIRYDGLADTITAKRAEEDFARKISRLVVPSTYGSDLAMAVSLMELMTQFEREKNQKAKAFVSVEDYPMLEWWRASREPKNSEWMLAPIGLLGGNKVRSLLFEAQGDGVHGMIAGTTGSGKSEMLLTLVLGLALRYDPSVINFVLADYKGGTAFDPFKKMPHAVDIVTNLQGSLGARTFIATKSEMNRRSGLLADSSVKHIVEYRKKNMHVTNQPFPFLFIIVDEFAEMVKEFPEFKGNLDSITRLGRALGVTLILATQRPAGVVTDQMRSNIKWRMCLRVESSEDSRELLKRSDAAFLPNNIPGRAYLQVGNDNVELMQVARAGGPYTGQVQETEPPVIWMNRVKKEQEQRDQLTEARALNEVLVELMRRYADENDDIVPQKKPWPDPLPNRLALTQDRLPGQVEDVDYLPLSQALLDWSEGEGSYFEVDWKERAMRAVVGLVDDPENAKQFPLKLDLVRGHAVIFGVSGYGKTVFLRTLMVSLAAELSPKELHMYALDFGGKGLDIVRDLPHVAALIAPSEDDRVLGFMRRMNDELEQRKAILSQARADTIYVYNAQHKDKPIPAILAIIDNFAEFRESYEARLDELITLTRDARSAGIHFVITAQSIGTMPSKLLTQFTERFTFKLSDAGDYSSVVGRPQIPLSDMPGRGFASVNNRALEMQVALAAAATEEDVLRGLDDQKKLGELVDKINKAWKGPRPQSIDLKSVLSLMELLSQEDNVTYDTSEKFPILDWWRTTRRAEKAQWMRAPIGLVTGNKVRSLVFTASGDGSHGMVAGTTGSGKSELLLTLVVGMAMRYDPSVVNFILADYKGGTAFDPFKQLPHAVDIITNLQGTAGARTFTAMKAEMNRRSVMLSESLCKHIVEYRQKNFHETKAPMPFLFIIVDEFAEMVKENPEFVASLDSITRLGRALGLSLILATQRPAGVVNDQMRANMKWRVCLRVETGEDSRELLKRPDAAFLPNSIPGRAYMQVGNEGIELMQVARAGGPYLGPLPEFKRVEGLVTEDGVARSETEAPAFSDLMTEIMYRLGQQYKDEIPKQVKPYPNPLPNPLMEGGKMTLSDDRIPGDHEQNPLMPLAPQIEKWAQGKAKWKGVDWSAEGEAMRCTVGLVDNPIQAAQLPLAFDFRSGHALVFGASGSGKTVLMRSIVTALASTHTPEEFNVYMMDFGGKGLDVLTDLPHVVASVSPTEDDRVAGMLRRISDLMEERKAILSQARVDNIYVYNSQNVKSGKGKLLPGVLVIIDNFAEFKESFESKVDELISLVRDARANGIHFVITSQVVGSVPNKLFNQFTTRMVFKMADASEYNIVVGRGVIALPAIPGRGYLLSDFGPLEMQVAIPIAATKEENKENLDDTKKLSQLLIKIKDTWKGSRPLSIDLQKALSLSELFALDDDATYETVEDFPILKWWEHTRKAESSDWMKAPLGLVTGNKVRSIVFEANADGVHGMVAGTTGSGKSELLLTLVAGMAMRYDPSVINFILADYKGGTAFDPFKKLPHAVDIVTNLQGSAGARTFTAMKAEMNRRSGMLADTRSKHIVEYRRKNFHVTRQPLPFLFVIVDEFAEMVKENPEFKGSLDSITRLGRALGVTLILATQRPAGVVTDQMRSNIKWRICLRVETGEDSRELLNSIPGRGFLQVGNDNIELMQVARAGGPYRGPLPTYFAKEEYQEFLAASGDTPALSDVLTLMMHQMQQDHLEDVPPQVKPYPDPLPTVITLLQDRLATDYEQNPLMPFAPPLVEWAEGRGQWHGVDWKEGALQATLGLLDNPLEAKNLAYRARLTRGHILLFGNSGSGKTTYLRSLVISLAATHTPAEMQVYALDFGGRGLDILKGLPHVGATIMPTEEERVLRLIRRMETELEARKEKLSVANAENYLIYNQSHPDDIIPAIVVLIDNFAEYKENYDNFMGNLISIARDGRANGVHLVITADQVSSVPPKLYNVMSERLSLQMADSVDYVTIVGRGTAALPAVAGRGWISVNRIPLELQVAIAVKATPEEEKQNIDDNQKLSAIIKMMKDAWDGRLPGKIDILRPNIPLASILPDKKHRPKKTTSFIGMLDSDLEPLPIDLAQRGPHFIQVGSPLTGKTTALRMWALSLASLYSPQEVMLILVDFQQRMFEYGGKHKLSDLPHVVDAVADKDQMERMVRYLKAEYETPNRDLTAHPRPDIYLLIDNYDDFSSVIGSVTTTKSRIYDDLQDVARKFGTQGFHAVVTGSIAITRMSDQFLKQVTAGRMGIGLDGGEAASALNARVRQLGEVPPGRGFLVRAGRAFLMQVATPQEKLTMEESLDQYVERITSAYKPEQKARWYADVNPAVKEAWEAAAAPAPAAAPGGFGMSNAATRATSTMTRVPTRFGLSTPAPASNEPGYDVDKAQKELAALQASVGEAADPFASVFEESKPEGITVIEKLPESIAKDKPAEEATNGATKAEEEEKPANGAPKRGKKEPQSGDK
jgi:DNA segregation ATPase FtsK/SpoIIIE, S-DNA-T family